MGDGLSYSDTTVPLLDTVRETSLKLGLKLAYRLKISIEKLCMGNHLPSAGVPSTLIVTHDP